MTNKTILGTIIAAVFVIGALTVSFTTTESNTTTNSDSATSNILESSSMMAYAERTTGAFNLDQLVSDSFQDGFPLQFDEAKCVAGKQAAKWCEAGGTIDVSLLEIIIETAPPEALGEGLLIILELIVDSEGIDTLLTLGFISILNDEFAANTGNAGFEEDPTYSELSFKEVVMKNDDGTFSSELRWHLYEEF